MGEALDSRVAVRLLFEASSVESLAARVESEVGSGDRVALVAQVRPERVPLSLAQQRMWFLNRFEPGSAVNNLPLAIRLTGSLNVAALQVAVADLVARHEILRTVYPEFDGEGYQQVLSATESVSLAVPVEVATDDVVKVVTEFVSVGFDVTSEVPVRARLFRVDDHEHVLVFVVHHIAGDGFSFGPLSRDVMAAYAARLSDDAPNWEPWQCSMPTTLCGSDRYWVQRTTPPASCHVSCTTGRRRWPALLMFSICLQTEFGRRLHRIGEPTSHSGSTDGSTKP